MKEQSPVIKLPIDLNLDTLNGIYRYISARKLMQVKRYYFFIPIFGYSLYQACNYISEINEYISIIENKLSISELSNSRVVEKGIAIGLSDNIVCEKAIHYRKIDYLARHVIIPITGLYTLDNYKMSPGNVYIIDNRSGYRFTAIAGSSHLVYSYLDNTITEKLWDLWKNPDV